MKNFIIIIGVLFFITSCYSRRDAYIQQRSQEIRDSMDRSLAYKKGDDDDDGVINYYDSCNNTPKNARVYANGCAMDVDFDGVIDLYDKCVTVVGTKENNGCPE